MNDVDKIKQLFLSGDVELAKLLCNSLSDIDCLRIIITNYSQHLDLIRKAKIKEDEPWSFYVSRLFELDWRFEILNK